MRIIARKGAIKLIEHDGGNYKVIYFDKGINKTLLLTKDVMLAFNYYLNEVEQRR